MDITFSDMEWTFGQYSQMLGRVKRQSPLPVKISILRKSPGLYLKMRGKRFSVRSNRWISL